MTVLPVAASEVSHVHIDIIDLIGRKSHIRERALHTMNSVPC